MFFIALIGLIGIGIALGMLLPLTVWGLMGGLTVIAFTVALWVLMRCSLIAAPLIAAVPLVVVVAMWVAFWFANFVH